VDGIFAFTGRKRGRGLRGYGGNGKSTEKRYLHQGVELNATGKRNEGCTRGRGPNGEVKRNSIVKKMETHWWSGTIVCVLARVW